MKVTITGADDNVDIGELELLSQKYKFLEWALLYSSKRIGTNRYPSPQWLYDFAMRAMINKDLRFAIHLCGAAARQTMNGKTDFVRIASALGAKRIQLNGYVPGTPYLGLSCQFATLILQCRDSKDLDVAADEADEFNAVVLFDPSGGLGKEIKTFPHVPYGVEMGYAGGINPNNVDLVLQEIVKANNLNTYIPGLWIDMESGVRTNDQLDLNKVTDVLEKVLEFNERNQDNIFGL